MCGHVKRKETLKIVMTFATYEESIHWNCDVLFGELSGDEESF